MRRKVRIASRKTIFIAAALIGPAAAQVATRPATQPAPRTLATQPARRPPAEPVERAENPHWSDTGCRHCHVSAGGHTHRIGDAQVEAVCLKCHDGRRATQEPHPVGRAFDGQRVVAPQGWPAPDGKVTCITCHRVHPNGDPHQPRPKSNPYFLREYKGDLLAFCGRCHVEAERQGLFNPHTSMLDANGKPTAQGCQFCHTREMETGAATRAGDPALRAEAIVLCLGCHQNHIEWFEPGHIGAKVTPAIRAALDAFERQRGGTPGGPAPATQPASTTLLPLGRGGDTLVCSTCHNPHQEGVFPPASVLGAGAIRPGQPAERLRGLGKELCGACHGK